MPEPSDEPTFPPHVLREYALVADGQRGVLVGPRGDVVWMCFPGWDDPAVFSTLIGGRGVFAVEPVDRFVWGGFYEEGSLIWHSRWVTDSGAVVECREALALPAEPDRAVLLRRLTALEGDAHVELFLDPRADFGRTPLRRLTLDDAGRWRGRLGSLQMSVVGAPDGTPVPDGHGGRALRARIELSEGTQHDLVLGLATDSADWSPPDAITAWARTEAAWRTRVPELGGVYARRDARQAYAVLSGLTSSGGGMVAAATTSLPERAREGRNYDYRFVWIRDQCMAGQAVAAAAGDDRLLDEAVRFVQSRVLEDGPELRPMYTTRGGRVPREQSLDLPGYPGGADVVGNRARDQFQLDVFGEALLLFATAARLDRLDADGWRAASVATKAIASRWREPDCGIWELDAHEWTHSRLICAAGLRAIAEQAPTGAVSAPWLALADRLVADAGARCVHPSGRWQRAPGDERVDAALLFPAVRGAVPPDDPRALATLEAVADELGVDGFAYRFRPDTRPLGEAEGAFLLCGFALALAYLRSGEPVKASRWFERNRTACGPPGLLSEEFDVTQRQLRGNLPQAFVHAMLLECAAELGRL